MSIFDIIEAAAFYREAHDIEIIATLHNSIYIVHQPGIILVAPPTDGSIR